MSRSLVAVLHRGSVLLTDARRLPEVLDVRWPTPAELLAAVPGVRAIQTSPTVRISEDPRVTLSVFTALEEPRDGTWREVTAAELEPEIQQALAQVLRDNDNPPANRPDWYRTDWLAEVTGWIDDRLVELDRIRTGPINVIKIWSLSAVLEVPIRKAGADGAVYFGAVYFKATCEWFRAEPVITAKLLELFPGSITPVLAIDAARSWMLMDPLPTVVHTSWVDVTDNSDELAEIAVLAAGLQIRSVAHLTELQDVGCPDRTPAKMVTRLKSLVEQGYEIPRLTNDERTRLIDIVPWLEGQLLELAECQVPNTLVHGDLHAGNVSHGPNGQVIFDWTDACISHPFLDLVLLAARATNPAPVQAAFLAAWRQAYPAAAVDRAWALMPVIDRIFQAVTYDGIARAQEPGVTSGMEGVQATCFRALLELAPPAG